ncbi:hypothetical protein ACH19I_15795 [Yersinia kristensenii]|uniref:hypothetical protein n=1 Tax=Yersinia kristensenii TaxID=28152 RepID=UPI003896A1FE
MIQKMRIGAVYQSNILVAATLIIVRGMIVIVSEQSISIDHHFYCLLAIHAGFSD